MISILATAVGGGGIIATVVALHLPAPVTWIHHPAMSSTTSLSRTLLSAEAARATWSPMQRGISTWLANTAAPPPSQEDIQLLRDTFSEFYGAQRDLPKSLDLLTQTIERWKDQPDDEVAGLYRVRGDCHILLGGNDAGPLAIQDYTVAIELLQTEQASANADPAELPLALLGRARAAKAMSNLDNKQLQQALSDYETSLKLSSREGWDTTDELLEDGALRNPYAAWEWGEMLRQSRDYARAHYAHALASTSFDSIGDRARSIMALLDAGIDLAASPHAKDVKEAISILQSTIPKTKGVEARDVQLLQRVVSKEGEARMALAALLWNDGQKPQAERIMGEACVRLDQLQADAAARAATSDPPPPAPMDDALMPPNTPNALKYSMDDDTVGVDLSCASFKRESFLADTLGWPETLRRKVNKLETLQ